MTQYRQKLAWFKEVQAEGAGWFEMAQVMAQQRIGPRFHGELHKGFIIGIVEHGNPGVGGGVSLRSTPGYLLPSLRDETAGFAPTFIPPKTAKNLFR